MHATLWTVIPLLATAVLSAPAPSNSSLLGDNIPADFSFDVRIPPGARRVDVADYWQGAFRALLITTIRTEFLERSNGVEKVYKNVRLVVSPASTPSQLQTRHVIWAIQRLSQKMYNERDYSEVQATLTSGGVLVGTLSLTYVLADSGGSSNITQTLDEQLPQDTQVGVPLLRMKTKLSGVQVLLKDLDMFYTFICFMADYASKPQLAIADEIRDYRTHYDKIGIGFKHIGEPKVITWNRLNLGLTALVNYKLGGRYRESTVTWYSQDRGQPEQVHGALSTWGFYLPPGTNPGTWQPGNAVQSSNVEEMATS